jgi:PST family polysaccharide transporter
MLNRQSEIPPSAFTFLNFLFRLKTDPPTPSSPQHSDTAPDLSRHTDTTQDSSASPSQPENHAAGSTSSIQNSKSNTQNPAEGSSYGQILRSSSIIGGATGINYVIGLIRTKAVAVLLGPSGVGLVGMYVSITGLVSVVTQLGIDQSGVRAVAEANGTGDSERVARVVKTLRRVCWLTGIMGWILTVALAWPLSQWTFGSAERKWAVAILGFTVLIGSVTGGQKALLQGMRRIGDLARIQVFSAVLNTLIAVGLYAWLREQGIVPVITLTAISQLGVSWFFARRVRITQLPHSWAETAAETKHLVSLGAAFMYGAVLNGMVGLGIRSIVVRDLGLDSAGIYQAAWGLSGLFAGLVLGAMGTDFYPRLTAVASDRGQIKQLVNEQIEISILLCLPGLLGTVVFAPWLLHIFYSAKFLPGAELLPWFVLGVFCQTLTWPMAVIPSAKGAGQWFVLGQTNAHISNLLLSMLFISLSALVGIGYGFAAHSVLHFFASLWIAKKLAGFSMAPGVWRLLAASFVLILAGVLTQWIQHLWWQTAAALAVITLTSFYALRGIVCRLGNDHPYLMKAVKIPGAGLLLRLM